MYQRILVPIDGSSTAQRGLAHALALAKAFDAQLVLLTVLEPYSMMSSIGAAIDWGHLDTELEAHARRVLEHAHEAAQAAGVACETQLADRPKGRVCDVVTAQARTQRCDLIVMGTHGRRGLSHALIGSDAERVLRHAPCHVLLVRDDDEALPRQG